MQHLVYFPFVYSNPSLEKTATNMLGRPEQYASLIHYTNIIPEQIEVTCSINQSCDFYLALIRKMIKRYTKNSL